MMLRRRFPADVHQYASSALSRFGIVVLLRYRMHRSVSQRTSASLCLRWQRPALVPCLTNNHLAIQHVRYEKKFIRKREKHGA
jgi:hypothetical protein